MTLSTLSPQLNWLLGTCSCTGCDSSGREADGQISLHSESSGNVPVKPLLGRGDILDVTYTPRPFGSDDQSDDDFAGQLPITPRQQCIKDRLELPRLSMYPVPPNSGPGESEEVQRSKLLHMYQEVAMDLHTGMYLTQLTASRDYSDIHCQLMEDLTTLKLDQSNGRIIEFPLTNVSKVYRIVKSDDKFYTPGHLVPAQNSKSEHIVVVEFLRRKLAFVYNEVHSAQRFMICMELLIRRAQQRQAMRSLTPTFPPRHPQANAQCPTPRQVYEAMSRGPPSPKDGVDRSL